MNSVDSVTNKVAQKINLNIFQYSKQFKMYAIMHNTHRDLIQKIDYGILTSRTTPASKDELKKIQQDTEGKLDDFQRRFAKLAIFAGDDDSASPAPTKKRFTEMTTTTTQRTITTLPTVRKKATKSPEPLQLYQCPLCPKEFYRMESIVKHMLENHQTRKDATTHDCPYCGLCRGVGVDALTQHLVECHYNKGEGELAFTSVSELAEKLTQVKEETHSEEVSVQSVHE